MKHKLFLLFIFINFSLGWASDVALHQYVKEKPLLYKRIPLVWDRSDVFTEIQTEKIVQGILTPLTKPNKHGIAIRNFSRSLKHKLEFMVIEPGSTMIPIPGMAIAGHFKGKKETFAQYTMELIRESLATIQGSSADWLKFNKVADPKRLVYKTFLLGHLWIVIENSSFKLVFSQSNPKFIEQFLKPLHPKNRIENNTQITSQDLFLYGNVTRALIYYEPLLKNFDAKLYSNLMNQGVLNLRELKLFSTGSSEEFSMKFSFNWDPKKPVWWRNFLKTDPKQKLFIQKDTKFNGVFKLPQLQKHDFSKILSVFFPKEFIKAPIYIRLYQSLGNQISFSWPKNSVTPVFKAPLRNVKAFNKEMMNLLKLHARVMVERKNGREYNHIQWGTNTLSYYIENNHVYFSPLLHGLLDFKDQTVPFSTPYHAKVNYPSEGSFNQAYYAMVHFTLQAFVALKTGVNPNDFPAFSDTKLNSKNWKSISTIDLEGKKDQFSITWNQPYGLPGLISGANIPASAYISFLSLLSLTLNSF